MDKAYTIGQAARAAGVGIATGSGTDIALDSADIIILNSRHMRQNVGLAFLFNGVDIPLAATGVLYPVWAVVAMAASVTTIFVNTL